jgi:hypothetical protein
LTGYYRRFVRGYADIAVPLSDLLRAALADRTAWTWQGDHQRAFEGLRAALTSAPVLRIPVRVDMQDHQPFVLYTDASDRALAAVLSQTGEDDL